ncbi:hypothetical protein BV96_01777 [Sphingomonas paucimobilis]|nr:hypothetical protein BV96_01777 [Sphingomonas paucimobilis]
MERPKRASVMVTCDCSHKFELSIEAVQAAFRCPACGVTSQFDDEQLAKITAGFGKALMDAARQAEEGASHPRAEVDLRK